MNQKEMLERAPWAIALSFGSISLTSGVSFFDIPNNLWANLNGFIANTLNPWLYSVFPWLGPSPITYILGPAPNFFPIPLGNFQWAMVYALMFASFSVFVTFEVASEVYQYRSGGR